MQHALMIEIQEDFNENPAKPSFELLIQIALKTGKMRFADFLKLSNEEVERIPSNVELTGDNIDNE